MKQFIAILVFTVCLATSAKAQTFLNDLQKSKPGEGKITVTQSADIDNLVNNAKLKYAQEQASKQKAGQNVVPQDDKDCRRASPWRLHGAQEPFCRSKQHTQKPGPPAC